MTDKPYQLVDSKTLELAAVLSRARRFEAYFDLPGEPWPKARLTLSVIL